MRKTTNTIGQWECHRFLCGPFGISILLRGYKFSLGRAELLWCARSESHRLTALWTGDPRPRQEWRGAPAWRPKRRGCVAPSICLNRPYANAKAVAAQLNHFGLIKNDLVARYTVRAKREATEDTVQQCVEL